MRHPGRSAAQRLATGGPIRANCCFVSVAGLDRQLRRLRASSSARSGALYRLTRSEVIVQEGWRVGRRWRSDDGLVRWIFGRMVIEWRGLIFGRAQRDHGLGSARFFRVGAKACSVRLRGTVEKKSPLPAVDSDLIFSRILSRAATVRDRHNETGPISFRPARPADRCDPPGSGPALVGGACWWTMAPRTRAHDDVCSRVSCSLDRLILNRPVCDLRLRIDRNAMAARTRHARKGLVDGEDRMALILERRATGMVGVANRCGQAGFWRTSVVFSAPLAKVAAWGRSALGLYLAGGSSIFARRSSVGGCDAPAPYNSVVGSGCGGRRDHMRITDVWSNRRARSPPPPRRSISTRR